MYWSWWNETSVNLSLIWFFWNLNFQNWSESVVDFLNLWSLFFQLWDSEENRAGSEIQKFEWGEIVCGNEFDLVFLSNFISAYSRIRYRSRVWASILSKIWKFFRIFLHYAFRLLVLKLNKRFSVHSFQIRFDMAR